MERNLSAMRISCGTPLSFPLGIRHFVSGIDILVPAIQPRMWNAPMVASAITHDKIPIRWRGIFAVESFLPTDLTQKWLKLYFFLLLRIIFALPAQQAGLGLVLWY